MKFENTPKSDGGSYEKPKPGKYLGILVGFAYVGTHGGGQFGPKAKVMLRWELHKRKGPSLDSKNFIHTVTANFGATVRGDNSLLRKCLEAHGIALPEGAGTDSHDWLGHGAWLDLDESADGKWINVAGVSRLDPEDDELPPKQLHFEHWEPDDGTPPPPWANWAVARSTDLAHLAIEKQSKGSPPAANGAPAPAAVGASVTDDDIPF
jgi:hypothetical protein